MSWNRRASGRTGRRPRSIIRRLLDVALALAILATSALVAARLEIFNTIRQEGYVRVADGDSLQLAGKRIRLLGIDAPELSQNCTRGGAGYSCGRDSKDALQALVARYRVTCEGRQSDRYGRLLATCTANGVNLNARQVEAGWAIAYGDYQREEDQARQDRRGIWSGEFDSPRDWRARNGDATEFRHDFVGLVIGWLQQLLGL